MCRSLLRYAIEINGFKMLPFLPLEFQREKCFSWWSTDYGKVDEIITNVKEN